MTEETPANVLMQDGPTPEIEAPEDNAEAAAPAEPPKEGGEEQVPQANADQGEHEAQEKERKRLGGWQRKIAKLEQQLEQRNEALIEALRRGQPAEQPKTAPADERPKPPKLSNFSGTTEEFETAVEEYDGKLEKYLETKRQQTEVRRQTESALTSLNERVGELPEFDQMKKAVTAAKMPPRLVSYLFQAAAEAKLKNGAEAVREAILDEDNREQLKEFDRLEDAFAIKTYLYRISQDLRLAQKKSAAVAETPPATTRAPKPPEPISKPAGKASVDLDDPRLSFKDFVKAREAQKKS